MGCDPLDNLAEFQIILAGSGVQTRPEVRTDAISGWPSGLYYGQVKIHSDGGSPANLGFWIWTSQPPGGDDWLWFAGDTAFA